MTPYPGFTLAESAEIAHTLSYSLPLLMLILGLIVIYCRYEPQPGRRRRGLLRRRR